MFDSPHPARVVALPGTGSDADFARRAFGPASAARGLDFVAVEPDPRRVVASCRAGLDAAARSGRVLAAGISLGAAIALEWAAEHTDLVVGVVAALPAWTGPDTAACPAALSAAATAAQLRTDGLAVVLDRMRASSPRWLADALTQSWRAQWPHLPAALDEAADYKWPDAERLAAFELPIAVVTAIDDPVHPVAVAEEWAALAPHARLHRITLDELGADPAILGQTGIGAFG
ncbi:alpha/beta hydrolase [Nocardia sp. NBC_00508]|uniref:alpha/beta hydrolase n=1 Tax=Nocardia sp. NBC_00508 TaxID=2975992 RepID=UPI002E81422A|nr:alpha/beta hydrolase [Nocardia sp. NBC_00508]WUD65266.1 alpha/beta hydrolase [Nocardia sp. NBC_00508]